MSLECAWPREAASGRDRQGCAGLQEFRINQAVQGQERSWIDIEAAGQAEDEFALSQGVCSGPHGLNRGLRLGRFGPGDERIWS